MTGAQAPNRHSAALEAAVGLFKAPDRAELLHASALPDDVLSVIRIASGDRALAEACEAISGLAPDALQEACVFYIQSVLFHPDSDHFRVLGAERDADQDTLKQHYRWLQKWLHPDRDPEGWSSVYSHRVNIAWDTLKRPDRRAAYRESLPQGGAAADLARAPLPRSVGTLRVAPVDAGTALALSSKWIRRLPAAMAVVTVTVAAGLWAAHRAGQGMLEADGRRPAGDTPTSVAGGEPRAPALPASVAQAAVVEEMEVLVERPVGAPPGAEGPAAVVAADAVATAAVDPAGVPAAPAAAAPVDALPPPREAPATPAVVDVAAVVSRPAEPIPKPLIAAAPVVPVDAGLERAAPARTSNTFAASSKPARPPPVADAQAAPPVPAVGPPPSTVPPVTVASTRVPPSSRVEPATSSAGDAAAEPARRSAAPVPAIEPAAMQASVAATMTSAALPAAGARPAPLAAGMVGAAAPSVELVRDSARLIREFSDAYRSGEVQRVVVLFKPNARTPVGNLIDLHGAYQSLFAQSSRRSLEFLQIDWRPTERGLVGTGRYEWAMRPRDGSRVRAAGGQFRIVIEFDDGRPLIAQFEQQDVG